ncbi:MAG: DUF5680 domain-containing protein [bacterium]|nr:DUF5680 domain-containing protein [bacterium]
MTNPKSLKEFLVKAKKSTYASGDVSKKVVESDKSTTLIFEDGDFKYHDNYFGGEPYGGREVVFFKGEPVYMMVYYGLVNEDFTDFHGIYKILQKALSLIPEDSPYRGPKEYSEGEYKYINNFIGEVDNFSGEESIINKGKEVYKAKYIGGLVDQRK